VRQSFEEEIIGSNNMDVNCIWSCVSLSSRKI